ncbi:hypothetical protein LTR97_004760 [Elasticomyces elasticus]|uniref:Zinc knuckle-domain-containing protein n=1 Tax=Elasticomyces elasticus TaxID=574655 RepID=A0AAN7W7U8_9PEZI|nr:hypothetical protein LTR97_004760 [Elasticomyces elasticus]
MNRSKATATTLCQKCLKKGHYSYECTSAKQERPYVSRPSRTQQLLNPKLAPKIIEAPPRGAVEAKADSVSAKKPQEADVTASNPVRRSYSSDSDSVSSISTRSSKARSPPTSRPEENQGIQAQPARDATESGRMSAAKRRRSRSPSRASGDRASRSDHSRNRQRSRSPFRPTLGEAPAPISHNRSENHAPLEKRERSLSPYSRRVALSRGHGHGS